MDKKIRAGMIFADLNEAGFHLEDGQGIVFLPTGDEGKIEAQGDPLVYHLNGFASEDAKDFITYVFFFSVGGGDLCKRLKGVSRFGKREAYCLIKEKGGRIHVCNTGKFKELCDYAEQIEAMPRPNRFLSIPRKRFRADL